MREVARYDNGLLPLPGEPRIALTLGHTHGHWILGQVIEAWRAGYGLFDGQRRRCEPDRIGRAEGSGSSRRTPSSRP
jgi:hypothetical protein